MTDFPILIKFIDAKRILSCLVHPDDQYAPMTVQILRYRNVGTYSVTMLVPYLYYGFKKILQSRISECNQKQYNNRWYLIEVPVHKGDVFFHTCRNCTCDRSRNSYMKYNRIPIQAYRI